MHSKRILSLTGIFLLALASCKKDKTPAPTPDPLHTITSITPTSGPKATSVTITGTNFGTVAANITVHFNNVPATIQTVTATTITVTVPSGAGTGIVKITKSGTAVNGPSFTYYGTGYTSTFAGEFGGFADGTGTSAQFRLPTGAAKDAAGNIFIADRDNNRIRKITPNGVVTTFAGSGIAGFQDGTGTAATFDLPFGITIDAADNLYVGEIQNNAIRKITPAGVVTTLAGNPSGFSGGQDGTGSGARFSSPVGLAVDASGNLFVADYNNNKIRRVTPAGVVTTVAGSTTGINGNQDGTGSSALFDHPIALAFDPSGNLIIADYFNHEVRKMTPSFVVTTIAGNGTAGAAEGTGSAARFDRPASMAIDATGTIYICDANNNKIRKITSAFAVTTLAGDGNPGNIDGPGTTAQFQYPLGLCADFTNKYLYVVDYGSQRIRRINLE